MMFGTQFKQGEIAIVPFPFTDLSAVKQRPVLILSNQAYNQSSEDLITCGITSNLKDAPHSVMIDATGIETGNIPKISRIKADKLFTINKSLIRKKIAKVNNRIMKEVREELLRLI